VGFRDWFKKKAFTRGVSYAVTGGNLISPEDNKTTYLTNGYLVNDLVYSVVNLITDKVRVAPWGLYKVKDESSLKLYKALMSRKDISAEDYNRAIDLRKKALEETTDAKITPLLENPNDYCSFQDLVGDSSVFKLVCGGRMIWFEKLAMGANAGKPQALHILPYNLVSILASRGFPQTEIGYKIDQFGVTSEILTKESVLHDKYFNPYYDEMGGQLFGLSPLKAALLLTTKSNEANKTEAAQFQNQGPKRIVFIDEDKPLGTPVIEGQIQAVKRTLQGREYSGGDNAGKTAFSGYKMGTVDIGLSPVDLGIIESEKWSLRRFCNIYGVQSQLLNDPENKTYNNSKEAEKSLTTRAALPLLISFRDHFNRKLKENGYKDDNLFVDFDTTVYTELQEDLAAKWAWVKELPISHEDKLLMMGIDKSDNNPALKEIVIPSGYVPIDSLNVVDEELNGEDADSGMARGDR
jgi:HK97 family phage portal protein